MIVYKSRRFTVRRYQYGGSGIVSTIGSLLARYATKAMLATAAKAALKGSLKATKRAVSHLIAHKVVSISGSDILTESVNTFKSAVMLRIEKLNSTIDFLKNELEERNFHIRTLLLRDANDGRSIDMELLETSQENIPIIETTSSVINDNIFNDEKISSLNQNQLPANDIIHNRDIDDNVNRVDATNSHNSSIVIMESAASNVSSVLDSTRFLESSNSSTNDESNYSSIVTSLNTSFTTIDNYEDHSFTINGAINKSDMNGTNEHPDKDIRWRETEINSFKKYNLGFRS